MTDGFQALSHSFKIEHWDILCFCLTQRYWTHAGHTCKYSSDFSHVYIPICLDLDAELTALRESDVSKLTKELDREKIKRKQLEAKLKKVKEDHDTTPKLRLCHGYCYSN